MKPGPGENVGETTVKDMTSMHNESNLVKPRMPGDLVASASVHVCKIFRPALYRFITHKMENTWAVFTLRFHF